MASFFEALWKKITMFFKDAEEFCIPFIKQFATAVGPIVLAAAEQAVLVYAEQQMSGTDKKNAAYNDIVDNLKKQGIQVGASIVNSAIEAAVARLKESGKEVPE